MLMKLLEPNYLEFQELIDIALSTIKELLFKSSSREAKDFCYIFLRCSLLPKLATLLWNCAETQAHHAMVEIANVFTFFSRSEKSIKLAMVSDNAVIASKDLPLLF